MSPDLAQGLGDCADVLHGLDVGRPGSISVICDIIATPPGAPLPSWESITDACNRADALMEPLELLTASQLAVAARPLQYEATGGRSGISERSAATNSAKAGVPAKGKIAKGVDRPTRSGESKEVLFRRMIELPKNPVVDPMVG